MSGRQQGANDAGLMQSMAQVDILPKRTQLVDPQDAVVAPLLPTAFSETKIDAGYEDHSLYVGIDEDVNLASRFVQQLEAFSAKGEQFISILYSARSISKAIPQLQSNDQENKEKLYEESIRILQPEVERMKAFLSFQENASEALVQCVEHLVIRYHAEKRDLSFIPYDLLYAITRLFGMLFTVDNLKNVKSAWSNDLSAYKRACSNLRRMDGLDMQSQQRLIFFLANNNAIINEVKKKLEGIKHFKEVLVHVTHFALDHFNGSVYLNAEQKHSYLKAIMFLVFVMDGVDHTAKEKDDKSSILKVKKLRLEAILKTFKRYPVIPLFGDMHIDTATIFRLAPHISAAKVELGDVEELNLTRKYEILELMDTYQQQYEEITGELAHFKFMAELSQRMHEEKDQLEDRKSAYFVAKKALSYVSTWTTAILEQAAWKYAHPTDEFLNKNCKPNSTSYEKAVRYNYSLDEQKAMIRLLTMINDVHGQLHALTNALAQGINGYVHYQIQCVVHGVLQRLLSSIQKAKIKKKKGQANTPEVIAHLCTLISDLDVSVNIDASEIAAMATKKQAKKSNQSGKVADISMPNRRCGPTTSQLLHFRSTLNMLVGFDCEKGALLKRKDMSPQQFETMKTIYEESAQYLTLLQFEEALMKATDLSSLWFKEFHLELAKEIQFPIEFSLPWMLMGTAMTSPDLHQHMLLPLELYNQAAQCALFTLKSQTLYDEIEAEVNTCFDQIVFKITQQVYTSYKTKVHATNLPQDVITSPQFKDLDLNPGDLSYTGILSQRHIRLLGRTVDLNAVLSASMNTFVKQTINMAINWFESKPLSYIVAFEHILKIEKLTHSLLSESLGLIPFDDLLEEQNHSVNPASNYGRIAHKVIFEALYDLCPKYVYKSATREFTEAKVSLGTTTEREPAKINPEFLYGTKALGTVFHAVFRNSTTTVRVEHAIAIINLVEAHRISSLVTECATHVALHLHQVVRPFVSELVKGMPKRVNPPNFEYGVNGIFQFYQLNLKTIVQYPDLQTEVFPEITSIGNVFCFIQLLEEALEIVGDNTVLIATPFGELPAPIRRIGVPTLEQVQRVGKHLGVKLTGGLTDPVVVSDVMSPSVCEDLGIHRGDEILAVGNTALRDRSGEYMNIDAASGVVNNMYGQVIVVKSTKKVPYTQFVGKELDHASQAKKTNLVRRAKLSAHLSDYSTIGSILKGALQSVDQLLTQTGLSKEWGGLVAQDEVYSSAPEVFYKLWSAIDFALLLTKERDDFSPEALFGDGLHWGGLSVVYLLGQSSAFELFDYSSHWLDAIESNDFVIDQAKVGGIDLNEACKRALHIQRTNRSVLNLMRTHFPLPDERGGDQGGKALPPSAGTKGLYCASAREQGSAERPVEV